MGPGVDIDRPALAASSDAGAGGLLVPSAA
jgi:hypothetical protein